MEASNAKHYTGAIKDLLHIFSEGLSIKRTFFRDSLFALCCSSCVPPVVHFRFVCQTTNYPWPPVWQVTRSVQKGSHSTFHLYKSIATAR